ncbi:hypothetical protein ACR2RG_003242 [Acinetobacter baumannii]
MMVSFWSSIPHSFLNLEQHDVVLQGNFDVSSSFCYFGFALSGG